MVAPSMRATVCARLARSGGAHGRVGSRLRVGESAAADIAAAKKLNTLARRRAADIAGVSHRAPPAVKGW